MRIAAISDDKPPARKHCEGIEPQQVSYQRLCRLNGQAIEPTFVVWGDSHGMVAMPSAARVAQALGINGLDATSNGCVPFLGVYTPRQSGTECQQFNQAVLDVIQSNPNLTTIFLHARWAGYAEGTSFVNHSEFLALAYTDEVSQSARENLNIFKIGAERTIATLLKMGKRVVIVESIPEQYLDVPQILAKNKLFGRDTSFDVARATFLQRQRNVQHTFEALHQDYNFYTALPAESFCDETSCSALNAAGEPLYIDDNHLSSLGSHQLDPLFKNIFDVDQI